jgi:hypothetical protein
VRIVTEHAYDCEPEAFWAHHLDEASRRAKEVEGCGAVSFRVLSNDRQGDTVVVRSELVEARDLPAAVRRIFGETLRVEEVLHWAEGSNTASFHHTPETLADRVHLSGRLTTEPVGSKPDPSRRHNDVSDGPLPDGHTRTQRAPRGRQLTFASRKSSPWKTFSNEDAGSGVAATYGVKCLKSLKNGGGGGNRTRVRR